MSHLGGDADDEEFGGDHVMIEISEEDNAAIARVSFFFVESFLTKKISWKLWDFQGNWLQKRTFCATKTKNWLLIICLKTCMISTSISGFGCLRKYLNHILKVYKTNKLFS
jgi:hypothetical protein